MAKGIVHINPKSAVPKYRQVMNAIIEAIENKTLCLGDKLPSINKLCTENFLKRDTIMHALNELRSKGIISGQQGKGYYITSTDVKVTERYFLLFGELNQYSGSIYNALVATSPIRSVADIYFHNNTEKRIKEILEHKNGEYTSYIIDYKGLEKYDLFLSKLPVSKTCLIGKPFNGLAKNHCVYHDHDKDIYEALRFLRKQLKKYCRLVLLTPNGLKNNGLEDGFSRFCEQEKIDYLICSNPDGLRPALYEAYFVPDDTVLVNLINQIRNSDFKLGENIGIVTFGDSLLKEVAEGGLTAIAPDFEDISNRILEITRGEKRGQMRIRSKVILRKSL